jgi:hypothetical protein
MAEIVQSSDFDDNDNAFSIFVIVISIVIDDRWGLAMTRDIDN